MQDRDPIQEVQTIKLPADGAGHVLCQIDLVSVTYEESRHLDIDGKAPLGERMYFCPRFMRDVSEEDFLEQPF